MDSYQYKVMPAPQQVRVNGVTRNAPSSLTATLESEINFISSSGWEFVRVETVTVRQRAWGFFERCMQEDLMVFRRPLSEAQPHVAPSAAKQPVEESPIRPRRVRGARAVVEPVTKLSDARSRRKAART